MAEAKKSTTKKVTAKTPKETSPEAKAEILVDETTNVTEVAAETTDAVKSTAKAGKRSAKAVEAVEAEIAKEERKAGKVEDDIEEAAKPKQHKNPTRPRVERQGKNFQKAAKLIDKTKLYSLEEALTLATTTNPVKFDATVELHINLGVDPRHADQNIRDNLVLPQGTGKKIVVAVFADVDDAEAGKKAGADIVGEEAIAKLLDKGTTSFDILVATPSFMPKLGKYARLLGPRGLMPNPKSGTVTTDVTKAVAEAKAGRVEYRVDGTGIIHMGVGKVSFGKDKLLQNVQAITASVKANKPASVKGSYVKAIHITTTMGPSINVEINTAI
jgi:large subunit ribosomal protein L1